MLYKILPNFIFKRLFGDRRKWGLKADYNDADYQKMLDIDNIQKFYEDNQKGAIGSVVNHFGFTVMRHVDLTGKVVVELGPGTIEHLDYNKTKPEKYILVDIRKCFLEASEQRLRHYDIEGVELLEVEGITIPLDDDSADIIITFHQLEHIYELEQYFQELKRILKPDGLLVGAVPAEGGLAWGLGRFLTSRRYVQKHMDYDYDKVICWEHPNFVTKIKNLLDANFVRVKSIKRPLGILPFDFNLSWSFVYRNAK